MNPSSKNSIVPFDEMELMKWMVDRFRGANRGVAVSDPAALFKSGRQPSTRDVVKEKPRKKEETGDDQVL